MKIPFCRVQCDGNELAYVRQVLDSGWLTTAGKCFEFERKFSAEVGGRHAVAVNSATAALHLAVEAIGVGPGDEVIVPSLTFTASAEVVRYVGADPVFVDVEYGTGLLTPEIIEQTLASHPKVKAVMVVHFAGQAAQMPRIMSICRKHGIKVIEDAAHAFPASIDGRMIGGWGTQLVSAFMRTRLLQRAKEGCW